MKIVLAVDEDKKTIVKRTGQSAYFAIYEDDKLVKLAQNKRGHHAHKTNEQDHHSEMEHKAHTNSYKKDVESLKDCANYKTPYEVFFGNANSNLKCDKAWLKDSVE
jgi:hypothetical protein